MDRAAALIDLVIRSERPLSFTELSDQTGLARSTTSRLLAALERTELLEREPEGGYVGGQLFALHAALHDPWPQVVRLAQPVLQEISDQCGETVHLGVPRNARVVHIAQVDSRFLLAARDWNQVDVPAHCSALGKVFYAFGALPLPSVLVRPTEHSLDHVALERQLVEVRRRHVARTRDELEAGLSGLAAPVRGADGRVIAALGVSGPTQRLDESLEEISRLVLVEAERLTTHLRQKHPHQEGAA